MTYTEACGLLQIARGAPLDVAEAAYRALSKRTHPDVGGDTRRMALLSDAVGAIRAAGSVSPVPPSSCRTVMADDVRLPWGKHKGMSLSVVPLGYLAWLASECDDHRLRLDAARVLHVRAAALEDSAA